MLCLCRPVIGPWVLRENNALGLANQSACYFGYKRKPYNLTDIDSREKLTKDITYYIQQSREMSSEVFIYFFQWFATERTMTNSTLSERHLLRRIALKAAGVMKMVKFPVCHCVPKLNVPRGNGPKA